MRKSGSESTEKENTKEYLMCVKLDKHRHQNAASLWCTEDMIDRQMSWKYGLLRSTIEICMDAIPVSGKQKGNL